MAGPTKRRGTGLGKQPGGGLKGSKASPGPRGTEKPFGGLKREATVRQMSSIPGRRMDKLLNNERGASNGQSRPAKPSGYPSSRKK